MNTKLRHAAAIARAQDAAATAQAQRRQRLPERAYAQVLALQVHRGRQIATVQIFGDQTLAPGDKFTSKHGEKVWRVLVIGFVQPAAWEQGIRDIELEPVDHTEPLNVGELLVLVGYRHAGF